MKQTVKILSAALLLMPFNSKAQRNNDKDTNTIVAITYPALTVREGTHSSVPIPPNEHPRLLLTAGYLPILKEKINSPLLKDCWDKINVSAAYSTTGDLPLDGKYNNSTLIRDAIEAKALLYLMNKDSLMGRSAVDAALHYLATLKINHSQQDITRDIGRAIVTGSMVYDWCYSITTLAEKNTLIARMETLAAQMEIGWPQIKESSVTGHTTEAQIARDMLCFGIATYSEKPVIYNRVAGRIFAEFVPARQFFYPANYHHQGSAYGAYRYYWDLISTLIFDRMGYPNLYGKEQVQIPYYFVYNRRPDGQLMRDGDDYNEQFNPFGKWWNIGNAALLYTGSNFKDPLLINEGLKERQPGESPDFLFDFLLVDPTIYQAAATKSALPLSRYFGSPLGAMTARTGFTDGIQSNDVVAEMKIQEYNFSNHQHLDAGSFQLYYKGPLAVQSGIYQGTMGSYGCDHFRNYSQRTIAHNCMLIDDTAQQFKWHDKAIGNDGGQPYANDGQESTNLEELMTQGYQTGKVLAHHFGPDAIQPEYTYLKGELAAAYGKKVKSFKRSFVFLNLKNTNVPAALIVFDRVQSTNKNFGKTWLLHCVQEPTIAGNTTTVVRNEKGYDGQLINTTLLPLANNLSIKKVGGSGNEFSVRGKNYPQSIIAKDNSGDSAVWRIEVCPKNKSAEDNFLNVLQVMDYNGGQSQGLAVEPFETNLFTGVKMGDRLVLFNKKNEWSKGPLRLTIANNGNTKVLITDLQKGIWKVVCLSNKNNSVGNISNTNNLIYFTAAKGDYLITKE